IASAQSTGDPGLMLDDEISKLYFYNLVKYNLFVAFTKLIYLVTDFTLIVEIIKNISSKVLFIYLDLPDDRLLTSKHLSQMDYSNGLFIFLLLIYKIETLLPFSLRYMHT
ncbi:hypothetical protein ACJX0J_021464, partial [Zea mays]